MKLQPKILELLQRRGITSPAEIEEFLSAKPRKTYDPFLLLNMEAGVDLLLSCIEEDRRICIYGDYDADGITSTVLLLDVLSELTDRLTYYIPSRFTEGYGLNCDALAQLKADGVDLVVTVDCGSVSCEEAEYARKIGLELLITDHHTVAERVADGPVINPKQPGCGYPCKDLAGVGVAFKLAQAVAAETGLDKRIINRTLDLVGIGTIGDIVPLLDENRTLTKFGLRAIRVSQRPGLQALVREIGLQQTEITAEQVSYGIAPHLNAAGRMADARIAVEVLRSRDPETVQAGVARLIECNRERKRLQEETFAVCRERVETLHRGDLFYVIDLEDAHEGITGIVAGKIKDTYGRPTVLVTPTGPDCFKGTGRSIARVDLYALLAESRSLFLRFGGHRAACGFTMPRDALPTLRRALNDGMATRLAADPALFDPETTVDLSLEAGEVQLELTEQLKLLEPFGCGNPTPVVRIRMQPLRPRRMGSQGQYIRFSGLLRDGRELQCVIFRNVEEYDALLQQSTPAFWLGDLHTTAWNGKLYLQFTVTGVERITQ